MRAFPPIDAFIAKWREDGAAPRASREWTHRTAAGSRHAKGRA
jgi:hypothetical protein